MTSIPTRRQRGEACSRIPARPVAMRKTEARPAPDAPVRDRFPVGARVRVGVITTAGAAATSGRRGVVVERYEDERRVAIGGAKEWHRVDALVADKPKAQGKRRKWNYGE